MLGICIPMPGWLNGIMAAPEREQIITEKSAHTQQVTLVVRIHHLLEKRSSAPSVASPAA